MEADVLNALRSQAAAHLPGGRDRDARLLMLISVPSELQPWTKRYLELSIKYLLSILSQESQNSGFIVVIDTQKCQWRLARSTIRQVTTQFGTNFTNVIVVRPDAFWDKQRVENCAKTHKKGEPITIQKSRLLKYFEISELPEELGGTHEYNHEQWLQNRVRIEEFKQSHDKAINDLENLHVMLLDNKSIRANETEKALKTCTTINDDVQKSIRCVIDSGNKLVYELTESMSKNYRISQDHVDARESIKTMLNDVEKKQTNITLAWTELEKNFDDVRELAQLEDGVGYVTNWILGTAETLLNAQQKIGCDLQTCDELRRDHETMEMQCWETYGLYAELLHKIEKFPMLIDSFAHKDLMSQKDFMDFVCRSFATRLERRRNVLITSVRFYRMVSEYFDKTSEVFESLVMGNKIDDFEMASVNLQKLKDSQHSLDHIEKELEKEGEKLSDILSMPVKDALGRDIGADYSEDIATIRDILDATIARRNIFIDSVELQKLTLEQVTHIYAYEKDAAIAIKWIDDLYNVMIRQHSHVGCNVYEIQLQKEELQTIQETAKGTYNFGCQLLEAALALRHSCKLNPDKNREWLENLNVIWKNVQIVSQEQMTRLRVSAVFHRSIEDHCSKLHDLKLTVTLVNDIDDTERRRSRLRKYLSCRERLLVEVGRMVRLGRLLKTRLKEPFLLQIDTNETMADSPGSASGSVTPTSGNFIACDAITQKLTEVSKIAETLDVVLKEIQNCLDMDESSAAASTSSTTVEMDKKFADNNTTAATIPADRQSVDEWNSSFKSSTEDESFVTASDCTLTPQSRSSYRTASEGGTSPWWTGTEKNSSFDADSSDMDPEVPSMQLLSGVISSASASFDDSEHSFLSAHQSPMMLLSDTSDDAQKPNSLLNRDQHRNFDLSPIASTSSAGAAAKTGDNYQIKIVEIEPKLTFLGANIGEAVELQRQHDEVIKQLYGRNTPVDEFMPKAEELLLQKNANPDVLNAMGKSLNLAWDDVLKLMHQKKHILDLNANFHEKIGVSRGKMAALEVACRDTMIPIEIESVQEFLTKFKQLRIEVLASVMVALKEGNELLANLREVSQSGTIDSRPDHIKVEVKKSINQVEVWLEELHDRRNVLELAWQTRKIQLEQCLALAIFAKDLIELETTLHNRKNELNSLPNLGDSESSAIHLLQEYITLKQDAVSLRDKALKITRATEKLVATGCFAGDEACTKAYNVLSGCTEYLDTIDQIEHLLVQSKEFFAKAEKALSILEKLEIEVASTKHQSGSNEAISIQTKVLNEIVGLTEEPLKLGYALLGDVGRSNAEVSGIERVIEDIENRKIYLEEICSINSEHCIKISQSLNVFMEKYNSILSWLVSIAEAFLRKNNGMGSNQKDSGDFLKIHHQLLSDLETKGTDINNLLLSVTEILGDIEDDQRKDVDNKVESLHSHWSELRTIVENRVDLVSIFLQFLQLADSLSKLFEYVETILKSSPEDEKLKQLDSVWAKIKPAYAQLKLDGARFIDEASKVADPYLETKSACSCVEEILNSFSNRQFGITESWENWTCSLVEKREIELLLETIMTENVQTINSASKLDAQLYPIITTPSDEPATIKEYIREKLDNVLKEIGKASDEIQQKVHSTAQLQPKDESIRDKVTQVIQNLNGLKDKLETVSRNYRILLEALISFLDKIISTKSDIETYLRSKSTSPKPENVENVLREHEQFRENIMNKFRSLIAQSEQIIESIRAQEPDGAKEHDTDRILTLLEKLRILFETQIDNKTSELQKQDAINKFNLELNEIHKNFDDVTRQLNETESQNGDSSAAAKAVAMGFEYFERTIQLLEKRIDNFRQTSENVSKTYPNTEQFVGDELRKLLNRWEDLKNHTKKTRNLIDSSADYYALADNIDRKYRDHHNYLLNITNQIPNIHAIDQTNELINKIDTYINQNEAPQLELLKNLANKSKDLYGFDKTVTIYSDNISLFQSFFHLKNQLQSLAEQMRQNEELHLKETERQKDLLKLKLEEEQIKSEKLLMEEQKELQIQEQLRLQLEHEKLLNEQKIQQQAAERKQQELLHQQKLQEQQASFEQQLQEQALLQQQQQQLQQQQLQQQQLQQQQIQQQQMQQLQQQFVQQQVEIVEVVELNYEAPVFTQPLCDATIQEGDKIRFECHATGNPEPTIEWFKDGLSIQNNPDYHRTYDKGICTLSIEETFTEDSARFTCKASNCAGVSETTAKLSVKESTANEMLTAPTFLKLLENGTAKEGSSFEFHCTVSGNPLPTVQWFKNDICIDNAAEFAIFYNNGDAVLRIEAVHVQDQAVFSCKASNEFGFEQCSAGLNVKPLIPTEQPAFTAPLSNIMARVEQKIKLECQVSGNPRPDILWTHNGKEFIGGRDIKSQYDNQGKITLVIQEAFPSDAGVYIATAKNSAGEAYSSCNVCVKGRLLNETSDSEMASDMEPVKPFVQLPLKDISVFEGKSVRLDCVIVGQPEPEVIWYHNNFPVQESVDVQLLFQGDRCSLIIQEAYLEDAGEYRVVALNSAGETFSECVVAVTPLNELAPATRPQSDRILPTEMPPKFERLLSDILADEGQCIEFDCSLVGDPRPSIKWYLNNKEIEESNRVKFVQSADGTVKLIILNVSNLDKGVYTVKASNSSGDAKCFSHLIVKQVNSIPATEIVGRQQTAAQADLEHVCPTFKELFADKTVQIDDVAKFECIVVGKPTPKIRWFFNDHPVQGKNFLISTSGERQVLTVPNVTSETIGKISCVAENEIGKATCVAYLNMIGDLSAPTSEQAQRYVEEYNTESSNITIKKQIFTTTHTSQVNSFENVNGHPQTQVHAINVQSDHSFKQIGQESPEIFDSKQFQEYSQINELPPTVQQKSIVNFIKPNNGEIAADALPKVVRKNIAPRFVAPLIGKIVDQGSDVMLEAIVDGFPSPQLKITRNGEELMPNSDITISYQLNKVNIELRNVGVKDAGRYSCSATNAAGSSTSTADIVVKKSVFPPVFGHRLQAQVVKRGERVLMDVEVSGTPDPTVTWYKDNQLVENSLASEYKIKQSGNNYTLIIDKVKIPDAGKYMVRAVNAGGEAQSIADFAVLEPTPERMVEVVKTVVFDKLKNNTSTQKEADNNPSNYPESFHSSQLESSTAANDHGMTEQTIITETRRTTEATMRMEHKDTFTDIPLTFTQNTQTQIVPVTSEGTMIEPSLNSMGTNTDKQSVQTDSTQTPPQLLPKPLKVSVDADTLIDTTSIPKSAALDYFTNKINSENEAPSSPLEEKYTRFEDLKKPILSTPEFNAVKNEMVMKGPPQQVIKPLSKLSAELLDMNLVPGSPPEIGYMPKLDGPQRENISDRIKKLADNHKENPDGPQGGVRMLPQLTQQREEIKTEIFSQQTVQSHTGEPIMRPQARHIVDPDPFGLRSPSPRPSADGVAMEKLWTHPKHIENDKPFDTTSYHMSKNEFAEEKMSFKKFSSFSESDSDMKHEVDSTSESESNRKISTRDTAKMFENKIKDLENSPRHDYDLKAPGLVKQLFPKPQPERPRSVQEVPTLDIHLEPGTPPEVFYAPRTSERKQSLVESMEHKIEQILEKEPSKVIPGAVRTIPPPTAPTENVQNSFPSTQPKHVEFSNFPTTINAAPIVPSTFLQNSSTEKSYQSDFSATSTNWQPKEPQEYRSVKSPNFMTPRAKSTEPIVQSPCQFEQPPHPVNGNYHPHIEHIKTTFSAPPPTEPKPKQKVISGYMADTEESVYRKTMTSSTEQKYESLNKRVFESFNQFPPQSSIPSNINNQTRANFSVDPHHIPPNIAANNNNTKHYRHYIHKHDPKDETSGQYEKEFSSSSMVKNISMNSKHIKISEEPRLEPLPFVPEPARPRSLKVPPPPSPSKFIKGEFKESDYESDYDRKIAPVWKPSADSDSEPIYYKPIHPILTPTGRNSNISSSDYRSPVPPTEFERPLHFEGPPRPKFEPIDKPTSKFEPTAKPVQPSQLFKPKPVNAKPQVIYQPQPKYQQPPVQPQYQQPKPKPQQFTPPKPQPQPQQQTRYYTAVAGPPQHIASETSNTMHMRESTESSHRVVNMTQTKRVIQFDARKSEYEQKLEPFPYAADPQQAFSRKHHLPPPPTPTKFIPSECRESDYESEIESAKIRPLWTPNPSDNDDPHYRRVNAPAQSRSASLPRTYGRVLTPMEFDNKPIEMPSKIIIDTSSPEFTTVRKTQTLDRYSSKVKKQTVHRARDDMDLKPASPPKYGFIPGEIITEASSQMHNLNSSFKTRSRQFMNDVADSRVNNIAKPILKKPVAPADTNGPQAYREESRVSQYGTKHIDPDTGLIYFKYDFGYEFGIIFPGQGKKIVGGTRNVTNESTTKKPTHTHYASAGDISIPVVHEKTHNSVNNGFSASTPPQQDFPNYFESDPKRKRYSLPAHIINIDRLHQSPERHTAENYVKARSTTPIYLNNANGQDQLPKRKPIFITPLKDIAVVNGQTARFECIVQCDPYPTIAWSRNGVIINKDHKHNVEFRNGVCRLTIPQAFSNDAGTYSCTGTNHLGSVTTSADLLVPGDHWGSRK